MKNLFPWECSDVVISRLIDGEIIRFLASITQCLKMSWWLDVLLAGLEMEAIFVSYKLFISVSFSDTESSLVYIGILQ